MESLHAINWCRHSKSPELETVNLQSLLRWVLVWLYGTVFCYSWKASTFCLEANTFDEALSQTAFFCFDRVSSKKSLVKIETQVFCSVAVGSRFLLIVTDGLTSCYLHRFIFVYLCSSLSVPVVQYVEVVLWVLQAPSRIIEIMLCH